MVVAAVAVAVVLLLMFHLLVTLFPASILIDLTIATIDEMDSALSDIMTVLLHQRHLIWMVVGVFVLMG
jgi:hypothetical protein